MISPPVLIFTDLDGTLLDHFSYGWDMAKPALDMCKRFQVPVIMVSSKTRAEMARLRKKMALDSPFISENGGGIFFPKDFKGRVPSSAVLSGDLWKWSLGVSHESLVEVLREIRKKLGIEIRGFSDMTVDEISEITGLDPESSMLAARREYDEPFMLLGDCDLRSLIDWVKKKGLDISEGGRFFHLHGKNDKGDAVKKLISWYKESHPEIFSIALGDSPNDFSMLKKVDQPVLVRSYRSFSKIGNAIPGLKVTKEIGPEGWNSMVMQILKKKNKGGFS